LCLRGEQVTPGWYGIEVMVSSKGLSETRESHVGGWATKVLVLPPQGVLEKAIEVNKSRTVGGITVTLERVELTSTGMNIYAFNRPPGYELPQGPTLAPPQFMIHADAKYSLDGGTPRKAGQSGIRFLDSGMRHSWESLDPVPKGTKEMTFVITTLGEWEGPWEFKVSLDQLRRS